MIKRVLVAISDSPAAAAETAVAIDIAKSHGATVTGFTVVDPVRVSRVGPAAAGAFSYQIKLMETRKRRANEMARAAMGQLETRCGEADVAFDPQHFEGVADRTLADVWRFQDLCVAPTRPWAPGEPHPYEETAILHVVAMGLRPVLAVPPDAPVRPAKALVALSGSLDSAKSLKHFIQMGIWPDIPLHLVTIGKPKSGDDPARLLDEASAYVRDHGRAATTMAVPPTKDRIAALLDEASRVGAELFVIGSSYGRFLALERFGSHASGLLKRAAVPLFISH